ncbi:MAG: 2-hydroxyacid dehydrogenase [Rhodospirillales bacterium]|nr:2-hydroxyacid dehydrogenase [Rhodospirillales bacterium]
MKAHLVIICFAPDSVRENLASEFNVDYLADLDARAAFFATTHAGVEIVLTNGTRGISAAEVDRLPDLKLVGAFGAGYENIDAKALRAKGIAVTHGPGTNSKAVADHAMALLLASARHIVPMNQIVQQGGWSTANYQWPCVYGKRLGILGLGRIGMEIARRGQGFDLEIAYHNRSARDDVAFAYHDSLLSLAAWSDFLICAGPGGPATQHMVNGPVLAALGASGIVVNIGRGSIIDTAALVEALENDIIGGAGLDVLDGEPTIPDAIIGLKNLIVTPHVAGRAPEASVAKYDLFVKNVRLCLSGQPVATPVPDA